jgi:flagellar M-ring protein FliF
MVERLKKIPTTLLETWNKFTSKQKTLIISVVLAVFLTIVILVYMLSRTTWKKLTTCENTKQADEVVTLLDEEGIPNRVSDDGLVISVDEKRYTDALLKLGSEDIMTTGMTTADLFNSSITTTQSERDLKAVIYLQDDIARTIRSMTGVKDAVVYIGDTSNSYTIFEDEKEKPASVLLTVSDDFSSSSAEAIALMVASAIGNKSTEQIKVTDQNGNVLFNGTSDLYSVGNFKTNLEYKEKLNATISNSIYMMMLKLGYDDAQIGLNLKLDMDVVEELHNEYTPADGQEQGVYKSSYNYKSTGTNSSGGVPGTDSNDGTDYLTQDSANSNSETTTSTIEYLPNERSTNTKKEVGAIVPEDSSIAIILTKYVVYKEEDLKKQGVLGDMSFDEYVKANNTRTKLEVDEDTITTVANTTGISSKSISVQAFEVPVFQAAEEGESNAINYLAIILFVLIVALLLFVVFKGTAPVEVTEQEPELSVEQLLATTKENQSLEDIEFSEKSETRKMIEKFVDENPEAVAQLLRNWLNDDWG